MSGTGIAVWNPGIFLAMFPEFTAAYNANPARYEATFTYRAQRFLTNTPQSPVQDVGQRLGLLNMLVAHIRWLAGDLSADGQARPVGRVSDASEGSVSASFDYAAASQNNGQWFNQSQYGAEFWQATSSLRGFRYVGPPRSSPFIGRALRRFGIY
jgi:Protein of unknown function (DUF4054)